MSNQSLGQQGEQIATEYLQKNNYAICERNFRYKSFGELDIVARKKGKIVFAEVKTIRARPNFQPEDQITAKKQTQLRKMTQIYLSAKKLPADTPQQIDIIAIELDRDDHVVALRHHQNAIEDLWEDYKNLTIGLCFVMLETSSVRMNASRFYKILRKHKTMDLKSLSFAVAEVANERGISQQKIFEVIEEAIASAYKKEYGRKKQKIIAKLDAKNGDLKFWQVRQVVSPEMLLSDEDMETLKEKRAKNDEIIEEDGKVRFNSERHILIDEAKILEPAIKAGEEIMLPLESKEDFGRIAAQTAKQVILQKIKEVEKEEAFKEFKDKEGEVVSGIVQRIEPGAVFLDIGRTSAVLPRKEQIYNEQYRPGQRIKLFVLEAEQTSKGPQVLVSRIYPKLVSKLFELEVPEIGAKQLEIKSIAREPGLRSKVAVAALEDGIDPIGALVGQRGTRILAVINELAGEKIDVIEWNEKPEKFIANALSPAKVLEIRAMPKNKAIAIIQDDQLSLAIGKEGQNVRLAAKLTGWKIDIKSVSQVEQEMKEGKMPEAETDEEIAEVGNLSIEEETVEIEKPKKPIKKAVAKKTAIAEETVE